MNKNSNLGISLPDAKEINEYIKEYLQHGHFNNTFECFENEIKLKQVHLR